MTKPDIGHNSEVDASQLRSIVERVERLQSERKELADGIADVYAEARGNGFDVKVLCEVVKIRAQDRDKRREFTEILDLYLGELGVS